MKVIDVKRFSYEIAFYGVAMIKKFIAEKQLIKQENADSSPYYYSSAASCEDFYISPTKINISSDGVVLGVNGEWNAIPREVTLDENAYLFDPMGNGETAKIFLNKKSKDKVEVKIGYKTQLLTIHTLNISETPKINKYISILDLNGDNSFGIIIQDFSTAGGISVWEIYDNRIEKALSIDLGN